MRRAGALALLLVMGLGCGGTVDGEAVAAGDELTAAVNQQLARIRQATARYHDVQAAIDDGFVEASGCEQSPAGTMGIHYVNFARMDLALDALAPEALLYVPTHEGLRLVAVEYLMPIVGPSGPYFGCGAGDNSCPPPNPPAAPVLFDGHPFDGPMAGHNPAMPWHFDQHVWIWSGNPAGTFAQWNPALRCPAE